MIMSVAAVLVLGWVTLLAGVREDFAANPRLSANNYQAYPDRDLPAMPAAPAGYEPFFINHYGRHGSRWLIGYGNYAYPVRQLEKGERAGKLTARGREVLDILRRLYDDCQGREGELSDLGHEQHQGIARRMYNNFTPVFADGAPIEARSTVIIRCILSMQNEVDVLSSLNPRLNITTDASQATMYYMNYTDTVVKPLRERCYPMQRKYRDKWVNPKHMLKRLFTDQRWARDSITEPTQLMLSLFEIAGNMQSHHAWEDVDLYDLFSKDDIYNVWRYNNLRWYILSGETPLTECRVDYMEANLVRNLIEDADRAIMRGRKFDSEGRLQSAGASLRFGHESVVLPLCCLMGLNGADYRTTDVETLDRYWQSYKIFPMAANVQLVYFHTAASDDVLVLPLLNERVATLPVTTDAAPYYHWRDVRDYLINKLSQQPVITPAAS